MYHSISDGAGPISTSYEAFRRQMAMLEDCGRHCVSIREYAAWRRDEIELPERFVVLTFDDGYEDFATRAHEELAARKWSATVFVPAAKIGSFNDWERNGVPRLRLMDLRTISELARAGIEIGAHGMTHRDLTALSSVAAREEIVNAQAALQDRIGAPVTSFAPPYGRSNRRLRNEISNQYQCSAGTLLGRAGPDADLFDLPRIEMWYFRNPARWRAFLSDKSDFYLAARSLLRRAGSWSPFSGR